MLNPITSESLFGHAFRFFDTVRANQTTGVPESLMQELILPSVALGIAKRAIATPETKPAATRMISTIRAPFRLTGLMQVQATFLSLPELAEPEIDITGYSYTTPLERKLRENPEIHAKYEALFDTANNTGFRLVFTPTSTTVQTDSQLELMETGNFSFAHSDRFIDQRRQVVNSLADHILRSLSVAFYYRYVKPPVS